MRGLKDFYASNRITAIAIVLSPLLLVLSIVYLVVVSVLKFFYRRGILVSYRPAAKVISVGNITLGGSGKTPLVEYLVLQLAARRHRVAALLRGYQKPRINRGVGSPDYYGMGDEASMLKEALRGSGAVFSNPDRAEQARKIDQEGRFDTIILDDGFQHWRLKRDLDIVVVDATNPFGNGYVLPLGPLREPLGALSRADIIVLSRSNEVDPRELQEIEARLKRICGAAPVVRAVHSPQYLYHAVTGQKVGFEALKGAGVGVMAGVAVPASFLRSVEGLGAKVVWKAFFDDHHEYSRSDIKEALRGSRDMKASFLLTTEKDIVRFRGLLLQQAPALDVLVLKVAFKIVEGQERLDERLHCLYRV